MGIGLNCEDIRSALAELPNCAQTSDGLRFATQCLYPSFEPVEVYVIRYGEGFKVHDGGGAIRCAWDHARDLSAVRRALSQQAAAFHVDVVEDSLVVDVESPEWLASAILTISNASAIAAREVITAVVQVTETALKDRIFEALSHVVNRRYIAKEYTLRGRSGKTHRFDYGVKDPVDGMIVVNAVAPHHVSISSNYVIFADTSGDYGDIKGRFAVHDRPLESEDVALLHQVADIVPFASLEAGMERQLAHSTQ